MIEKRGGAQIGVLEENMQRLQQQVDDHTGSIDRLHFKVDDNTGSIDRLHLKVDGLEAGITEIRAMMEEVMKRLPVVKQPTMVQPEPQRKAQSGQGGGAPIVGNQPSICEPIETIPKRAETRNVIPMRAPNHEIHFNPNQPWFSMPYDDPLGQKGSMEVYFSTRL